MGSLLSNITNNPYVQSVNQTVVSNITQTATGAVNNILNNVNGALGGAGSITSALASVLASTGITSSSAGDIIASELDTLISGSSSFFTSGSPTRISSSALANRNLASQIQSNPETQIPGTQNTTNGTDPDLSYPPDMPPYYMTLQFGDYNRPDPFSNTAINATFKITLPLPDGGGLIDETSPRWSSTDLGLAGNVLQNVLNADNKVSNNIVSVTGDVAAFALGTVGNATGLNDVVQTVSVGTGLALNPATAMIFSGLDFRTFTFNWLFAPKTSDESNTLKQIINQIKAAHLPTYSSGGTSLLFNYPSLVKPYINPQTAQDFMTTFQWCVIKAVNVSYSPMGDAPSFYSATQAPVMIRLSLVLEEMEYRLPPAYGGALIGNTDALGKIGNLAGALVQGAASFITGTSPPPSTGGG